jgi:hypothetical protein
VALFPSRHTHFLKTARRASSRASQLKRTAQYMEERASYTYRQGQSLQAAERGAAALGVLCALRNIQTFCREPIGALPAPLSSNALHSTWKNVPATRTDKGRACRRRREARRHLESFVLSETYRHSVGGPLGRFPDAHAQTRYTVHGRTCQLHVQTRAELTGGGEQRGGTWSPLCSETYRHSVGGPLGRFPDAHAQPNTLLGSPRCLLSTAISSSSPE